MIPTCIVFGKRQTVESETSGYRLVAVDVNLEQRPLDDADFPYCAIWTAMLVPAGHFNVTISLSHPALWYVRKVPKSKAVKK